jgi:bifunctional UDP-N-acetylglucosamine pyrophosphorylase/glucosamine-1-phosphate N-acetyltransferase
LPTADSCGKVFLVKPFFFFYSRPLFLISRFSDKGIAMNPSITAVVLAAGKGTRMKSARAKVLHEVFFQPMIRHVLLAVNEAAIDRCAVIVGHQRHEVLEILDGYPITPVVQEEQLGTGHAVLCAEMACGQADLVMILCGDTPLIQATTLRAMIAAHRQQQAPLTLMTTLLDQPFGYGRILSNEQGQVLAIVEEKDATEEQRCIREINAGIYLVDRTFLFDALRRVGTDNSQGEVYLTDIVAIANKQGLSVNTFVHPLAIDILGVNSRIELAQAHATLQLRHNRTLMLAGVTLYAPETTLVAPDCTIGQDTVVEGNVRISGGSTVGRRCHLGSGCVLHDCQLGEGVRIGANSVLEHCVIPEDGQVLPLTYRNG